MGWGSYREDNLDAKGESVNGRHHRLTVLPSEIRDPVSTQRVRQYSALGNLIPVN